MLVQLSVLVTANGSQAGGTAVRVLFLHIPPRRAVNVFRGVVVWFRHASIIIRYRMVILQVKSSPVLSYCAAISYRKLIERMT